MVETLQPAALAILSVNVVISTFFIALRVSARYIELKNGGKPHKWIIWSDALLVLAYLMAMGNLVTSVKYTLLTGQGYHIYDIPKLSVERKVLSQKYNLANQLLYNPILFLVKASVIFFLFRIGGTKNSIKISLYILFAVNAALAIAIFIADLFQCTPLHYFYDAVTMDRAAQEAAGADSKGMLNGKLIKGGTCIDQRLFFLVSAGLACVTDLLIVAIPTLIVWDLKMTKKKKLAAAGMLSAGALVSAVSIIRLVLYFWRFSPDNKDMTYSVDYTTSSMEANLSIAAACIPALAPLLKRFLPKILGTSSNKTTGLSGTGGFQRSGAGGQFPLGSVPGGKRGTFTRATSDKTHGDSVLGAWDSDEAIIDHNGIRKTVDVNIKSDAMSIDGRKLDHASF